MAKDKKCECNWAWWIGSLILLTIGVWALAAGFISHLHAAVPTDIETAKAVAPWYFGGLLLVGLGKMAKWKSHGACQAHN